MNLDKIDEALERLNPEQLGAVSLIRQPILVMAPVGTGKTDVITLRAAGAVRQGTAADCMLCLSFTNKAAREMKSRLYEFLGKQAGEISTRTFHGLCAGILRSEAQTMGLDADSVIYDEEDCRDLFGKIWRRYGIKVPREEYDRFEFLLFEASGNARLSRYNDDTPSKPADIFHKLLKDSSLKSIDRRQDFRFPEMMNDYVAALRENHALDFSDLIRGVNILWDENPAALARWQRKFSWVQVDEVQDTNRSEYRILSKLASPGRNLSFFGDLDQTIYEWRGSTPYRILDQYRTEFGPITEFKFVRNYRSTRNILDACSGLIRSYKNAATVEILPYVADTGDKVAIHAATRLSSEAHWIVNRIHELRSLHQLAYRDIAVLTRTNFTARDFSANFEKLDLPHVKVEEFKFFQRAEIKNAIAHLKLLVNRHDGNSAARFLQTPPKGIGTATMEELLAEPRAAGLKISDLLDLTALEAGDPFRVLLEKLDHGDVVVFDLETTGLNRALDEIVEIAATRCGSDGAIEHFHAFLRSTRPVGDSQNVHHFSDEFLAQNGRDSVQVLEEFRAFCGNSALCGHNVFAFDLPMLISQMKRLDMEPPAPHAVFDTLDLTRRLYRLPRYALSQIAKSLQLKTTPTHKADDDVATTVELLLLLCAKICNGSAVRRAAIQRHSKKFLPCAEKLAAWKERSLVERPHELLGRVLEESGLAEYYQGQDDSIPRIQHLKELVRLFECHDDPALEPTESLVNLLNMASLGADIDRHLGGEDRVLLLTVHQAKGLEFDTVFIAGATDNEFPSFRSKREGRLDEEHRLFYVAISRAKKRLFLSYPGLDSRGRETLRSRYLGMLPENVVERR